MITRKMLENLVNTYNQEGAWAKLETLYIVSVGIDGFYNASRNIRIRYETEEPVKEVHDDIERLCGERGIYSRTDDTNEEVREVLAIVCEQAFPRFLTEKVIRSIQPLSKVTKRFVFLLYKEGSILGGKVSRSDETVLLHFTPAYEIIFGKLEEDKYKVHEKVIQEMVKAGLVYDCWWSSRKHSYHSFIVPPFAKEVWLNLPKHLPLPLIQVDEPW